MYSVLVPVDESDERVRAQVDYVTSLPAANEEVEATVAYVYPRGENPTPPEDQDIEEIATATLALEELEDADVATDSVTRSGDVADEIVEIADDGDFDAVVMGGRNRSGVAQVLMGSVHRSVSHNVEEPVVVVG